VIDVVFLGSGRGEEARGRDDLARMFTVLAGEADGTAFTVAWDEVDVDVLGDVALVTALGTGTLASPRRTRGCATGSPACRFGRATGVGGACTTPQSPRPGNPYPSSWAYSASSRCSSSCLGKRR